jgi:hypothetical protein
MKHCASLANLQSIATTSITPTPPPTTPPTPTSSPSALSPINMFKRGIKYHPSVYPTLEDELWNDNWHRSFTNQARAQDVSDVINEAYLPTTSTNINSFQEKQNTLMLS